MAISSNPYIHRRYSIKFLNKVKLIKERYENIFKCNCHFTFATGLSSCGDSFLETDNYKGVDLEGGLNTVTNVSTALNGTYYQLFYYAFAGNYALAIGDIPTDITYWNTKTGHFDGIYTYTFTDTDTYLKSIWEYGYKTADNAARVIQASQALYNNASDDEKQNLICIWLKLML